MPRSRAPLADRERRRVARPADARAAAAPGAGRLLDQRGDAARPGAGRTAAGGRRAAAAPTLGRATRATPPTGSRSPARVPQPLHSADRWHREAVAAILDAGDAYGPSRPQRAPSGSCVEFVSANPTGPLTAAGGARRRLRRFGRAPARGIAAYEVGREYLPERRRRPGGPLRAPRSPPACAASPSPRTATRATTSPSSPRELAAQGLRAPVTSTRSRAAGTDAHARADRQATLERFGVHFDTWFSERSLHEAGALDERARGAPRAGPRLRERGSRLAAHDELRRRQGPRPGPGGRRSRPTSPPTSPTTATSSSAAASS